MQISSVASTTLNILYWVHLLLFLHPTGQNDSSPLEGEHADMFSYNNIIPSLKFVAPTIIRARELNYDLYFRCIIFHSIYIYQSKYKHMHSSREVFSVMLKAFFWQAGQLEDIFVVVESSFLLNAHLQMLLQLHVSRAPQKQM